MIERGPQRLPDRGAADAGTATDALAGPQKVPLHTLHGIMDALADVPAVPCPACGGPAFFGQVYLCGDDHEAGAHCHTCGLNLLYLRLSAQVLLLDQRSEKVLGRRPVIDAG